MPTASAGGLLYRLSNVFELPSDVVLDLPKATMIGDHQLLIENHKGVLEYTPARLRVRTSQGEISVTGARLRIASLHRDELVIEGRIAGVQLTRA